LRKIVGVRFELAPGLFVTAGVGNSLEVSRGMKQRIDNLSPDNLVSSAGFFYEREELILFVRPAEQGLPAEKVWKNTNQIEFCASDPFFEKGIAPLTYRKRSKRLY
jgi:hypothetical protein